MLGEFGRSGDGEDGGRESGVRAGVDGGLVAFDMGNYG